MAKIDAVGARVRAVTPNDAGDLTIAGIGAPRAFYVGTTGNIKITAAGDEHADAVLFSNVPVGWFPVAARRVWSTTTTASNIVALYE